MMWGKKGTASVLFGGQFGSEGKGLAAAWLADSSGRIDIATTNAGAQAGHTTCFRDGSKFICYHLPTSGVIQKKALSYINAGSIIDVDRLRAEINDTGVANVAIHPNAAVITQADLEAEQAAGSSVSKIGSTRKGVGAAITNKILRRARLAGEALGMERRIHAIDLNGCLSDGESVVVEVPQGFDLSLNHGLFYPYATSRDCWVGSALSDSGIHPSFLGETCAVVRTFPIRVGNIYNENNELIGPSGPFYDDSKELDWAKDFPGVEPERTTVTQRVRRIATWSDLQYERMLRFNRPTIVFLNFCNYLASRTELMVLLGRMAGIEHRVGLQVRKIYGFGPCIEDVTAWTDSAYDWYKNRSF